MLHFVRHPRLTSAVVALAAVLLAAPAHAQAPPVYLSFGAGLGTAQLDGRSGFVYQTISGNRWLGAGVRLAPRLAVGAEYLWVGDVGFIEAGGGRVHAPLATVAYSPRRLSHLELRGAAGAAWIREDGWGGQPDVVHARGAPAGRVGLGFVWGGRSQGVLALDGLRARGPHDTRYQSTHLTISMRLDLTRPRAKAPTS